MIELKGEEVMYMCPPDGSKVDYSLNYEKLVREIVDELLLEKHSKNQVGGNEHEKAFQEEA